jgi:hypothetical protein
LTPEVREIAPKILLKEGNINPLDELDFRRQKQGRLNMNNEEINSLYTSLKPLPKSSQETYTQPNLVKETYTQPNLVNISSTPFFSQLHNYPMVYPSFPQHYFMSRSSSNLHSFTHLPYQSLLPGTVFSSQLLFDRYEPYAVPAGPACFANQPVKREKPSDEERRLNEILEEQRNKTRRTQDEMKNERK